MNEVKAMSSRREFLSTLAVGLTASAMRPAWALAADAPEIKSSLNAPIGLQLYSLREYGPKDLPGTLAKVRAMGFRDVESAGLWNHTLPEFRSALDAAGLTFGYHCHGYEFIPSAEGTLFDTFAGLADPKLVSFQVDVFHAYHGGADPAQLIEKHKGRVKSLHLKDLKKGVVVKAGTATAEADVDVPVGSGQIDYPAVLRAAKKAGVSMYYVEDESKDPLGHVPQSLAYLSSVKV